MTSQSSSTSACCLVPQLAKLHTTLYSTHWHASLANTDGGRRLDGKPTLVALLSKTTRYKIKWCALLTSTPLSLQSFAGMNTENKNQRSVIQLFAQLGAMFMAKMGLAPIAYLPYVCPYCLSPAVGQAASLKIAPGPCPLHFQIIQSSLGMWLWGRPVLKTGHSGDSEEPIPGAHI